MRVLRNVGAGVMLLVAGGCTASGPTESLSSHKAGRSATQSGSIALVATTAGLAGVPLGTSTPRWVVAGAVAAPDGSAVFRAEQAPEAAGTFDVIRIEPSTGAERTLGRVEGPDGTHVAAVEPSGGRVALVGPRGEATLVIDFDTAIGRARKTQLFEGTVEPEAYSLDGTRLFAARIYADRYHVHVLDLTTGEQYPTLGPDKTRAPEDMYGSVVQAALSPDRRQLATLYRDTTSPSHTAFVHLLSLDNGLTVCIDLHAPFGSAVAGVDAIAWSDDGLIAVGHRASDAASSMRATFDPRSMLDDGPQEHYHADARADPSPPEVPIELLQIDGFERLVAVAVPGL